MDLITINVCVIRFPLVRRRHHHVQRAVSILPYLIAGTVGVATALSVFPLDFLLSSRVMAWRPTGDLAQHIVGQRYLLAEPWRWPPTLLLSLNTREGPLNAAMVDAIPALALLLKPFQPLFEPGFQGVTAFYFLCWTLQPIAAVWALRSAGEKRLLPTIGIALASVSMPILTMRFGHAALCGHFLILVAIGLYVRIMRHDSARDWFGIIALQPLAVLVHPYLALMTLAFLAALPLSFLLRGDGFPRAAALAASGPALVLLVLWAFEYLGTQGGSGFGLYAMNLLSPFWPAGSWLFGIPSTRLAGAIGGDGGWEGYNWLGTGLLLGLVIVILWRARDLLAMVRRHAALTAVLIGLAVFSLSQRVGFGSTIVLDLGPVPSFLEQFRSTGRFFWPVAYVLLIVTFLMAARISAVLALGLGVLQFLDTTPLRQNLAAGLARPATWTVDVDALRREIAQSQAVTLVPPFTCANSRETNELLAELKTLASERAVPLSTTFVARWRHPPRCDEEAEAAAPLRPGELRVFLPEKRDRLAALLPELERDCRIIDKLLICRGPAPVGSP
jgi:hypothetical protein